MNPLSNKIVGELHKTAPYTMLAVIGLLAFAIWSYTAHALTSDVESRIGKLEQKVDSNGSKIDSVLALSLAAEIRNQNRIVCTTTDRLTREALQKTLDGLQDDYMNIKAQYYPVVACGA